MASWEVLAAVVLAVAIYFVGYDHGLRSAARMADERRAKQRSAERRKRYY